MASIAKRGDKWRAQIWVGNQRVNKSFDTKKAAQDWAHVTERRAKTQALSDRTFGDLLARYVREVTPTKDGHLWESARVAFFERSALAEVRLDALTPSAVAAWRDGRLKGSGGFAPVSGSTINRDMNLLSNVCRFAVKEWGWLAENPFSDVKRPKENPPRDRLVSDEEIARLIHVSGPLTSIAGRSVQAFRFSVETAMRAGEVLAMRLTNVFQDHVHIPAVLPGERKSKKRDVPLSAESKRLLAEVLNLDLGLSVWGLTDTQLESNFRKMTARAGIEGLTFHDSRHAAITRLAKRLDVLELARMVGHRDINQLLTYYNASAADIAKKL